METVTERLLHEERKLTDGESSYRNDGDGSETPEDLGP